MFLDNDLPVMDGKRCAELMRVEGGALPIICITARTDQSEACAAVGINEVLAKPFKRKDITAVLRRHIGGRLEAPGEV